MRNRRVVTVAALVLGLTVALVAVAAAQDRLPKLPGPAVLGQGPDSPGAVTFNHASHVDAGTPRCTTCHPRLFKILKPGATRDGKPITHDAMTKGSACGACHGKTAFGFDDCTMCHRAQ